MIYFDDPAIFHIIATNRFPLVEMTFKGLFRAIANYTF